jgi:hypothetical protein
MRVNYISLALFTLVNSATVEPCSTVEVSPRREAAKYCFFETYGAMWVLRAENTFIFYFFNQTFISVAASEPHPQQRY